MSPKSNAKKTRIAAPMRKRAFTELMTEADALLEVTRGSKGAVLGQQMDRALVHASAVLIKKQLTAVGITNDTAQSKLDLDAQKSLMRAVYRRIGKLAGIDTRTAEAVWDRRDNIAEGKSRDYRDATRKTQKIYHGRAVPPDVVGFIAVTVRDFLNEKGTAVTVPLFQTKIKEEFDLELKGGAIRYAPGDSATGGDSANAPAD